MSGEEGLFRQPEAARRLGVSERTLEKWRVNGRGPKFVRLGRAVAYDPTDIAEFIAAGRRRSTSDMGEAIKPPKRGAFKVVEGMTPEEIGEMVGDAAVAEVEAKYGRSAA
jgi:predicted DNA-binding transcriptional regulator AlpA